MNLKEISFGNVNWIEVTQDWA